MKDTIKAVIVLIVLALLMYGCAEVGKSLSYTIFYKGKVERTIKEMVKSDALQNK